MKHSTSITGDEPHWVSRSAFQIVIMLFVLAEFGMAAVLHGGVSHWWAVPLVLIIGHLMHGAGVGFHEASHGLLRRNRRFNEFDGVLIGVMSFMSFSLYRAAQGFESNCNSCPGKPNRLGLLGMRERVEMLGGTFGVESFPGQATTVRVDVPLPMGCSQIPSSTIYATPNIQSS